MTGLAFDVGRERDCLLSAENRFLQCDVHADELVGSAPPARGRSGGGEPEKMENKLLYLLLKNILWKYYFLKESLSI